MRILPISDIHNEWSVFDYIVDNLVGEFDILTISGDIFEGRILYPQNFIDLMEDFQLKIDTPIVMCMGNHDFWSPKLFDDSNNIYVLHNSTIEINGTVFYGTPYTTRFCNWNWMATEDDLYSLWMSTVPDHVDVMLSHGPPKYCCDKVVQDVHWVSGDHLGSDALNVVLNNRNVDYLFCGHIHATDRYHLRKSLDGYKTRVYNVSCLDEEYKFGGFNPLPKVIEI